MLNLIQRSSIRTKLLLIMVVAALPVILAVCYQLSSKYRADYREAEHAIQVTAQSIAFQHEAHIAGIKTLLTTLSKLQVVKEKDSVACSQLLQGVLKLNPSSHNIGIADLDGNLIASGTGGNFTIGDRKYFKDALRTKRFSVGEYTLSRAVGKPAIHFALPVLDDSGEVVVVIYATFDLNHFNSIFDVQRLPPNSALNITDHQGIIIHRYPPHDTVKPGIEDRPDLRAHMTGAQDEGVFSDFGRDGVKRILAFKRLQLYPDEAPYMFIRVSIPEQEALANIRSYLYFSAGLFALAFLFAVLCSHVLAGRYLVQPMERLAAVLRTATTGDFSVRTGMDYSGNELGMLAQLFDTMAESLEARLLERDLAEAGLRASEHKFSVVFDRSPVTMAVTSYPGGVFLEVNRDFTRMFGFSREEAVGRSALELGIWMSQADRSEYLRHLQQDGSIHGFETVMCRKDGICINILFAGDILEIDGTPCVLNVVQEITLQKSMEKVLRESERRFRELLENVHMVAVTLDRDGKTTFCNDFLLRLTGWSREEILGQTWFDMFIPQDAADQVKTMFRQAIATGELPFHFENPIVTRSGERRIIVWYNTLLKGSDGSIEGMASLGMDMTDYRNIEMQLLQSRKMEAVGQLAGGVAHDFNNLLTPILGYAEMIRKELSGTGGKVERVDHIIQAAMKARDLTRQLLSFGRKQTLDMRVIDLNDVVSRFIDILRRTIRESIDIRLNLSDGLAVVRADRTQIEQILMNLVVNAQDAIADNGIITIETGTVLLDEEYARQHSDAKPGAYTMLSVSDSGCGIDPESLNHIFEPFYTTKDVDKGTGLGLATVYGIVKQHEGTIWVYSEPGQGTVFKLFFPKVSDHASASESTIDVAPQQRNRTETILLVEDNQMVRSMVRDVLMEYGYHVLEAENVHHALELAIANPVDLLVTDVVMPEASGPELLARIQEYQPAIKVLFMSGYAFKVAGQQPIVPGDNYIQKPFTIAAIANKVSAMLEKTDGN